jgi:hypothetical protein
MKKSMMILVGICLAQASWAGRPILGAGGDACIAFMNAWTAPDSSARVETRILNRIKKAEGLAWIQGFASGVAQLSPKIAARAARPGFGQQLLDHVLTSCYHDPTRQLSSIVIDFLNKK